MGLIKCRLSVDITKSIENRRKNEKRRKDRRNENGLTNRQIAQKKNIENIKKLKEQGLSQSKVAKELSIGIATVKRYWNF